MQRPGWLRWLLPLCLAGIAWGQGGPPGGTVNELLRFANEPLLFYAATSSGVLRSTDGGLSWSQTGERLHGVSTLSVAGNIAVLYAATAEEGVFRSRDEGVTWEQINQGLDVTSIPSLALDPTNPNTVYAGSAGGGIFKTTNGGDNWTPIRTGLAEGVYLDIEVDPGNPQTVYAANTSLQLSGRGALFKSTDGGQSWTGFGPVSVFSITLDPANSSVMYLGTSLGVIKSVNAGPPFEQPTLSTAVVDVAVDPGNPAVLYAATRFARVAKSADGGQTWVASSQGLPRSELLMIALNPQDPAIVYAGSNGGGLFRSVDGGVNWDVSARGMTFATISALAVDPTQGHVMAAVTSGGAYRSFNGGAGWGAASGGLESFELRSLAFDLTDPAIVYGGSVNPFAANDGSLFQSTDGGLQWSVLQVGAPFYSLAVHPGDGRTVSIGTGAGVFRSRDGGQSFADISGRNREVALRIVDLEAHPVNAETLFAIVFDNLFTGTYQIYRTTNGGTDWTGAGATATALLGVAIDPNDPARVYIAAGNGVFRSVDGGGQYRAANSGFPDGGVLVTSVAVDAKDNSAVYAATSSGVFRSRDGADSWQLADTGLEQQGVLQIVPDPTRAGVLYAATAAGGVFKTADRGESWQPTGGGPLLTAAGVVNGADFSGGGVAPGEIASIFGVDLGPAEGVQPGLDPQTGKLATTAAGVRVFFGDVLAALFFVRADQLNVQVPFEVAGMERVTVRAEVDGAVSARVTVPVLETHPGLFGAVLNQDGSVNSDANRESSGRVVQLFATGQGLVSPAIGSGELAPGMEPFPRPLEAVKVTIGGAPATLFFAGLAPGFVGLLQVNAQIDNSVRSGPAEVMLEIGGGVTTVAGRVWVR
jgi:uncharacterized protein (TIGR03437 family)